MRPPSSKTPGSRFGRLLQTARHNAGLTQEAFAERSGLSRSTVLRWEAGQAERPDPESVRAACRALSIDPREATIALGFLTREEAYGSRLLDPDLERAIELMQDPDISREVKTEWLRYMAYVRNDFVHGRSRAS